MSHNPLCARQGAEGTDQPADGAAGPAAAVRVAGVEPLSHVRGRCSSDGSRERAWIASACGVSRRCAPPPAPALAG